MSQPSFRPAVAQDAPVVGALLQQLGYAPPSLEALARTLDAATQQPGLHVVLASKGAQVVGLMTLSIRVQPRLCAAVCSVDELVVDTAARGSGVGAALLEEAACMARNAGAARLELHTRRSRESYARGFYKAQGFVEQDSAVMRRDLTQGS